MTAFFENLNTIDVLLRQLENQGRFFDRSKIIAIKLSNDPTIIGDWGRGIIELISWDLFINLVDDSVEPFQKKMNLHQLRIELRRKNAISDKVWRILENSASFGNIIVHEGKDPEIKIADIARDLSSSLITVLNWYTLVIARDTYPNTPIKQLRDKKQLPENFRLQLEKHIQDANIAIDEKNYKDAIYFIDQALIFDAENNDMIEKKEFCEIELQKQLNKKKIHWSNLWYGLFLVALYIGFVIWNSNYYPGRPSVPKWMDAKKWEEYDMKLIAVEKSVNLIVADSLFNKGAFDEAKTFYTIFDTTDKEFSMANDQLLEIRKIFLFDSLITDAANQIKQYDYVSAMSSLLIAREIMPDSARVSLLISKVDSIANVTVVE